MRGLILTILLFSISSVYSNAYAQEAIPTPPPIEEVKAPPTEETVFTKASDGQLLEAQNFYKSCTENETMSARKDCKCAATQYLEARIELGAQASDSEIITKNINTCLKNGEKAAISTPPDNAPKVTDKQLEEAELMYDHCKRTLKLHQNYDCECYAAKYLDGRIKLGPIASKESILISFQNECRNIVETTGIQYSRCMVRTETAAPRNNIEPKDYCECYARKWGALFKAYKGNVNRFSKRNMRLSARSFCNKTEAYQ